MEPAMPIDELIAAKNQAYRDLMEQRASSRNPFLPGRHYSGVGIGYKNGDRSQGLCLRYYVRRKLSRADVPPSHRIRKTVSGFPTDVVETGMVIGLSGIPSGVNSPLPPPATSTTGPGSGISYMFNGAQGPYGTVAAVLEDGRGNRYALSGNHVLARNGAPLQRPGFQVIDIGMPGPVIPPAEPVGSAVTFAGLVNGSAVDCAMVKADARTQLRQRFPAQLGTVTDAIADPLFHQPVRKFGYVSGFTEGAILDQFANIQIDFGVGLGVIHFEDAALIVSSVTGGTFATQGDSGSLVVQQGNTNESGQTWEPMGLVVGGTQLDAGPGHVPQACVFVCPLSKVLVQLGGKLDPKMGNLVLARSD
jgi:hypothetical protein